MWRVVVEAAEEAAASTSYPEDGGGRFLREVCYHTQNNVNTEGQTLIFHRYGNLRGSKLPIASFYGRQ